MTLFSTPPKSICILRLSAIGDVCNALSAVQQIQRYWKDTQITWIVGKTEMQLLQNVKGIRFIPYDKKAGWKGILALWKTLRGEHFDVLLNMQTALRASMISLGIKATYKVGFSKNRAREGQWLFTQHKINEPNNPHVLAGFWAFVEYLGLPVEIPKWDLAIGEKEISAVRQFIDPTRKNLLISPCSSKSEKDWLPARYVEIANIAHQQNINVILCGSSSEREQAIIQKILSLCEFQPVNASGKTSLLELAALIGLADLVLTPDSGPAHIATAQGTPVIGLYAYHNPLRTGPYNNLPEVVSVYEQNVQQEFGKPLSELPWATKLKGKDLMAQITVDSVVAIMKQIGFLK